MPLERVDLESIASIPDSKEKIKALTDKIRPFVGLNPKKSPDARSVKTFINFVANTIGENDTTVSKPVLLNTVQMIEEIDEEYNAPLRDIVQDAIEVVRPKYTYFCESLVKLVEIMVDLHQAEDEHREGARLLSSIDTDDQYVAATMNVADRIEWRIRNAEFFLEDEDNTGATQHIQKSRRLLRDLPENNSKKSELELRHKTCYSRILDSERKFLQAAVNYLELSQISTSLVSESDLLISLENAVTCAILAKAGSARKRVLAMLYRDERSRQLTNFKVLEKMHLNRILSQKEESEFSKTLKDHHRAELAGGLTVLQKAVYEHNMLAASQLYQNIRLEELGKLLGVSSIQAEDLARGMIQEDRMKANIDQVDGIITFATDKTILLEWDQQIGDLCMSINDLVDKIDVTYPGKFNIP